MSEGLTIIIVGAGFCGLTAAIECKLRGMNPILLEAYPTSRNQGDVLDFMHNGGRHIKAWDNGSVGEKLLKSGVHTAKTLNYFSSQGSLLPTEPWIFHDEHYHTQFAGHRGLQHSIIADYAKEIGVDMRFGTDFTVTEYLDNEKETGVITKGGQKILGDVVLACDGPRSLARDKVLGLPDNRVNSGYAIYRAWYDLTDEHRKIPQIARFCNPDEDQAAMILGKNMHAFVYTWDNATQLAWVLTHKDEGDIGESWSFPGDTNEALRHIEEGGFSNTLTEVALNTPKDRLVDYKLVWRDPIPTWLSKSRKLAVMGDAAHCHLPTSAQGACQAVEDAVCVASCLQKANGNVPLALQVFERIRFNRSHVIHMSSISNRDAAHATEWTPELVAEFPDLLSIPHDDWIIEYDVAEETENHFARIAAEVKSGKQGTIEELSLPAGGSFAVVLDEIQKKKQEPKENMETIISIQQQTVA
ncbi:salicylate hydroxylase [Penicillium vulpinum]|uniref:FAD-binding domain-containing protein n=1 Tax=Penicillium vulpinum TaxID=29845 RepID=A0A1V6RXJ3_9EURO|nr:salicylate hydroxylase [Penicillium vulpinum]KAJ5970287.1 salicylate hydroxylase [Penicillium vulpinum]OQE06250.1 hypothetical protein PENVUL_c019G02483 [Penicillium vulpinum]